MTTGTPGGDAVLWLGGKVIESNADYFLYLGTMMIYWAPEVFGICAMGSLLIGMMGCEKAMHWAGSFFLLTLIGGMCRAAL